jgi:TetR/AcrR family tetracycline transcriptional repressor
VNERALFLGVGEVNLAAVSVVFAAVVAMKLQLVTAPGLALHAITTLTRYVNGLVLQEQAAPGNGMRTSPEQVAAPTEPGAAPIPANLLAALQEGGSLSGDAAFERGLRMVLDGVAAALDTSTAERNPPRR